MSEKKPLDEAWKAAFDNPGEKVPVGRAVVCDVCSADWTDRPEPGGFLFGSYSYCPDCAREGLRMIKKYKEERYIVAMCGEESFADFVRRMRGPDAYIRVTAAYHPRDRCLGCGARQIERGRIRCEQCGQPLVFPAGGPK